MSSPEKSSPMHHNQVRPIGPAEGSGGKHHHHRPGKEQAEDLNLSIITPGTHSGGTAGLSVPFSTGGSGGFGPKSLSPNSSSASPLSPSGGGPLLPRLNLQGLSDTAIAKWSDEQVGLFLRQNNFGKYEQKFVDNNINGDILMELSHEILRELEIVSVGERMKLLKISKELRRLWRLGPSKSEFSPMSPQNEDRVLSERARPVIALSTTSHSSPLPMSPAPQQNLATSNAILTQLEHASSTSALESSSPSVISSMSHYNLKRTTSFSEAEPTGQNQGNKAKLVRVVGEDGQTRMINLTDLLTADSIKRRILEKFSVPRNDGDNYSIFIGSKDAARRITDDELTSISATLGRHPKQELFLRRKPNAGPASGSSMTSPSGLPPSGSSLSSEAHGSASSNGTESTGIPKRRDTIKKKFLKLENFFGERHPKNTALGSAAKPRGFFGDRPPSELITSNIDRYFPINPTAAAGVVGGASGASGSAGGNVGPSSLSRSASTASSTHRRPRRVLQRISDDLDDSDSAEDGFASAVASLSASASTSAAPTSGGAGQSLAWSVPSSSSVSGNLGPQSWTASSSGGNGGIGGVGVGANGAAGPVSHSGMHGSAASGYSHPGANQGAATTAAGNFQGQVFGAAGMGMGVAGGIGGGFGAGMGGAMSGFPGGFGAPAYFNGMSAAAGANGGVFGGNMMIGGGNIGNGNGGDGSGNGAGGSGSGGGVSPVNFAALNRPFMSSASEDAQVVARSAPSQVSSISAAAAAADASGAAATPGASASSSPGSTPSGGPIAPSKWIKGALIGMGSFGSVFLGLNPMNGELMAVKQVELPKADINQERKKMMVDALQREINLLKTLDHGNIVRYLGSHSDENHLNIFLEYVPGGSVTGLLNTYGAFEEPLVKTFVRQILLGLEYLHERDIIHRDIKGGNILVDNKGCVKISDFGISKKLEDDLGSQMSRASLQGSIFWMAPEVIKQHHYTKRADIWSLGCLIVEMFTGDHPFPDCNQVQAIFKIGSSSHPDIPECISEDAKDFILRSFAVLDERPTATQLLHHAFITN